MAEVKHSTIHVVDGIEKGESPQIAVQLAGKRTSRPGETLVLFMDLPAASPSMCADIARTLSDGYWRAPGGVTTALRLALSLANDRLIEVNRGVPAGQQAQGSLSCIVVKDQSLIIAQSGPAIAYARARNGAFERIEPPGHPAMVGASRASEPTFTHFAWQPGDVFILTGHGSCSQVNDPLVEACMGKGEPRMVAGYLNANTKQGKLIGVTVGVEGQPGAPTTSGESIMMAPVTAPAAAAVTPSRVATPQSQPQAGTSLTAAGATATAAMGSAARSMQRSLQSFGAQLLPARPRGAGRERSRATIFLLAAIAVLLPIIVAVIVSLLYFQLSGEAERQQLQTAAQEQVAAAKAATDPAAVKQSWAAALDAIAAYEAKRPDDTQSFIEDKALAAQKLDEANGVTRVTPNTLAELSPAVGRRRIGAASLGVYALDTGANTAEYYVLDATRASITGKPVPIQLSSVVTPPNTANDVAWASPSSNRWRTEGAVFFGNNTIYEYSTATSQVTPIALPEVNDTQPGLVVAGELYNDTSYLLDTQVGQIWRYTYQANTFTRADTYFRSPFTLLKDGVDMAIDGSIYVLTKNGAVSKFFNRAPVPFNITNLPVPLGTVVAIAVSGMDSNSGNVFVADGKSGAIFMLTKAGAFARQFRGVDDAFVGLQDISLDLTSNTLYVVTADRLYSFKVN